MKIKKHTYLLLIPFFISCGPGEDSTFIEEELATISKRENCPIHFSNETSTGGDQLTLQFGCAITDPYMPGRVLDELLVKFKKKNITHEGYILQAKNKKLFFSIDQPGLKRVTVVKDQFMKYLTDYTNNEISAMYSQFDTSIISGTKHQLDSIVAVTPRTNLKYDGYALFSDSLKNSYIQLKASNKEKNLFSLTFSAVADDPLIYGFFIK